MAKKKNGLYVGIAAVIAVVAIVAVAMLVLNGRNDGDNGEGGGTQPVNNSSQQAKYDNIDVSVKFGDYDEMYAQSKAIQNGEMVGKVIKVEGVVSHPMTKYSIVQENADGNKIGTEFEIDGATASEYPNDGDHVIITGEVYEKSPMYFIIKTTPEYVEVVEAAKE